LDFNRFRTREKKGLTTSVLRIRTGADYFSFEKFVCPSSSYDFWLPLWYLETVSLH